MEDDYYIDTRTISDGVSWLMSDFCVIIIVLSSNLCDFQPFPRAVSSKKALIW